MKKEKTLNDTELKINGISALNKMLGHVGAFRFIALIHREPPMDSVELSRQAYAGQSIDEIFERAKRNWSKRSRK